MLSHANFMRSGLKVRAAGVQVGRVTRVDVTSDNQARLELRIDNNRVWPLPAGTKARLRWGGTAKFSDRYVELVPAASGPPLGDGAVLRGVDTTRPDDFVSTPTEFDEVFGIFTPRTRKDLKAMLDVGGASLTQTAPQLRRSLDRSPPALEESAALLGDLDADPKALDTLVRSSDRVVDAIHSSEPDVGRLVSAAGTTFGAIDGESQELSVAIDRMPATLTAARKTMSHADRTLVSAAGLARRLDPGVAEVKRIARPLTDVLSTVVVVGPDVRQKLATVRRALPDLDPLVDRARSQMPAIASIGKRADHLLECIRPYAPELMGFFQNWSSGFSRHPDGGDGFIDAAVGTFPWTNGDPRTTGELNKTFPAITSPFLTPPGMIGGQPWWQPQCGSTPERSLDPTKDIDNMPLLGAKLASLGGMPRTGGDKP
jgi:virulence factor Mce-like protein